MKVEEGGEEGGGGGGGEETDGRPGFLGDSSGMRKKDVESKKARGVVIGRAPFFL